MATRNPSTDRVVIIGASNRLEDLDPALLEELMDEVLAMYRDAGAVLDTMELYNDPTFEQRGIMQEMPHARYEPYKIPAWPVRVDGSASKVKASPILGEHVDDVLHSWLGMTPQQIAQLLELTVDIADDVDRAHHFLP